MQDKKKGEPQKKLVCETKMVQTGKKMHEIVKHYPMREHKPTKWFTFEVFSRKRKAPQHKGRAEKKQRTVKEPPKKQAAKKPQKVKAGGTKKSKGMEDINWWPLDKEEQEWNKGSEGLESFDLIPQIPEEVRQAFDKKWAAMLAT